MPFQIPPLPPVTPFEFGPCTLPNMCEGPQKVAALAWLNGPGNNSLLDTPGDSRPCIAARILAFIGSPEFQFARSLDAGFRDKFLDIISALAPEYVHGTPEVPCYLAQWKNQTAVQRIRMIEHLRSLGFSLDEEDSPGLQ